MIYRPLEIPICLGLRDLFGSGNLSALRPHLTCQGWRHLARCDSGNSSQTEFQKEFPLHEAGQTRSQQLLALPIGRATFFWIRRRKRDCEAELCRLHPASIRETGCMTGVTRSTGMSHDMPLFFQIGRTVRFGCIRLKPDDECEDVTPP